MSSALAGCGFLSGAISGAVSGTATGAISGLIQYGMTEDPNAIWRGALIGLETGAVFGGITSGIQAKMAGGNFLDGAGAKFEAKRNRKKMKITTNEVMRLFE